MYGPCGIAVKKERSSAAESLGVQETNLDKSAIPANPKTWPRWGSCAQCQNFLPSGSGGQRCTACKIVQYCNRECQLVNETVLFYELKADSFQADWKRHKPLCKYTAGVSYLDAVGVPGGFGFCGVELSPKEGKNIEWKKCTVPFPDPLQGRSEA